MTDAFGEGDVALAIAGDRAAVEAIARAFLPRVYGLCLRLARRRDVAEEATQETFVRALRALPKLREPERLASWLLTIAANTAREMMRKRGRERALEVEPAAIVPADDEREQKQKALDRAVAGLEDEEREIFLLHTVEGVALDELARARDVTVQAMKSRVHRVRAKVRCLAQRTLDGSEA